MINWIQGNPLGRKFKALVTHDGTFVADAKISTDELWFMEHDVSFLLAFLYAPLRLLTCTLSSSMVPSGQTETTIDDGIHLPQSTFCNSARPI